MPAPTSEYLVETANVPVFSVGRISARLRPVIGVYAYTPGTNSKIYATLVVRYYSVGTFALDSMTDTDGLVTCNMTQTDGNPKWGELRMVVSDPAYIAGTGWSFNVNASHAKWSTDGSAITSSEIDSHRHDYVGGDLSYHFDFDFSTNGGLIRLLSYDLDAPSTDLSTALVDVENLGELP